MLHPTEQEGEMGKQVTRPSWDTEMRRELARVRGAYSSPSGATAARSGSFTLLDDMVRQGFLLGKIKIRKLEEKTNKHQNQQLFAAQKHFENLSWAFIITLLHWKRQTQHPALLWWGKSFIFLGEVYERTNQRVFEMGHSAGENWMANVGTITSVWLLGATHCPSDIPCPLPSCSEARAR